MPSVLKIIIKKNKILVFLDNRLFFKQNVIYNFLLSGIKLSRLNFFLLYVFHVLSRFGLLRSISNK